MSGRPKHPNKEIEAAVAYLEGLEWTWKSPGKSAHCWGRMLCPQHDRAGCQVSVFSTPRSAENHAKHLRRHAKNCAHSVSPKGIVKEGKEAENEDV